MVEVFGKPVVNSSRFFLIASKVAAEYSAEVLRMLADEIHALWSLDWSLSKISKSSDPHT